MEKWQCTLKWSATGLARSPLQVEIVRPRSPGKGGVAIDDVQRLLLDLRDGIAVEHFDLVVLSVMLGVHARHVDDL